MIDKIIIKKVYNLIKRLLLKALILNLNLLQGSSAIFLDDLKVQEPVNKVSSDNTTNLLSFFK